MCAAERRYGSLRLTAMAGLATAVGLIAAAAAKERDVGATPANAPRPRAANASVAARLVHVYPNDLPPGVGHDLAGRACLLCHSATLITQQRKDSTAWTKTITTMAGWGAPLDSMERDTLRGWLVEKFGPRGNVTTSKSPR